MSVVRGPEITLVRLRSVCLLKVRRAFSNSRKLRNVFDVDGLTAFSAFAAAYFVVAAVMIASI